MNITNAATATKRDIEVMKKYFDNGTASIGSLCRKLPFLYWRYGTLIAGHR